MPDHFAVPDGPTCEEKSMRAPTKVASLLFALMSATLLSQGCSGGSDGGGTAGSAGGSVAGHGGAGVAGSGAAGTGVAGGGVAGTGVAGSGVAGTGVAGSGTAGTGVAGSGAAGTGAAGSGAAGTGVAGSGAAGTGVAGSGAAGTGVAGSGAAGTGVAGSGAAGRGGAGGAAGGTACNSITLPTAVFAHYLTAQSTNPPMGGDISDGLYALTELNHYGAATASTSNDPIRGALRFTGNAVEWASQAKQDPESRSSHTYVKAGTNITLTNVCPTAGPGNPVGYSATPTKFTLFLDAEYVFTKQ